MKSVWEIPLRGSPWGDPFLWGSLRGIPLRDLFGWIHLGEEPFSEGPSARRSVRGIPLVGEIPLGDPFGVDPFGGSGGCFLGIPSGDIFGGIPLGEDSFGGS